MVKIIQITKTDWPTYIKMCEGCLGYSPTRGLDAAGIQIEKNQGAFIQTLDLNNHPEDALKRYTIMEHTFLSFVAIGSLNAIRGLGCCGLQIVDKECIDPDQRIAIVSGLLSNYYLAIAVRMNDTNVHTRKLLNEIKIIIERLGFEKIFDHLEEVSRADGTFVVRYRSVQSV